MAGTIAKIAIIGSGQIGTSLALAMNEKMPETQIAAFDNDPAVAAELTDILQGGSAVKIATTLADAVRDADIVVLATPIDRFGDVLRDSRMHLKNGAIITDVGSGKQKAIAQIMEALPPGTSYVPAHPANGKAGKGPKTADANMFLNQPIIITPDEGSRDPAAIQAVENFWGQLGGNIKHMTAAQHDTLYGTISHFEHVIAFSSVLTGANGGKPADDYMMAGNQLLALTRIADASPDMWVPVFRDNKDAILNAARNFKNILNDLMDKLSPEKQDEFLQKAQEAHDFRKPIPDRKRESITGDIADFVKTNLPCDKKTLTGIFNHHSHELARTVTLPALLGIAIALNARDAEKQLDGIKIAAVANPSFKDGSAPALSDPAFMAGFLVGNRDALLKAAGRLEKIFDRLVQAIEDGDEAYIRETVETVRDLRKQMPPARTEQDMRAKHLIT